MSADNKLAIEAVENRPMRFLPLAEAEEIELTVATVRNTIATRSKRGNVPDTRDVLKFMMLCKSRRLNPFVGDAYLIGYDEGESTTWTLITAIQALRKRAEAHPQYDGCRRGVILRVGDKVEERDGAWYDDGEKLLGAFAEVYRKDRRIPDRETVKLATYNKGYSRWLADPGGMIIKVAEAAALRRAFPSDLGGLYLSEEFNEEGPVRRPAPAAGASGNGIASSLSALAAKPIPGREETDTKSPAAADTTAAPSGVYTDFIDLLGNATTVGEVDSIARQINETNLPYPQNRELLDLALNARNDLARKVASVAQDATMSAAPSVDLATQPDATWGQPEAQTTAEPAAAQDETPELGDAERAVIVASYREDIGRAVAKSRVTRIRNLILNDQRLTDEETMALVDDVDARGKELGIE